MKNKLQSSFGLFSFLFVAITFFPYCSTTMLSERGTAGNWPARSNEKKTSKPRLTYSEPQSDDVIRILDARTTETFNSEESSNSELKITATKQLNLKNIAMTKIQVESDVQPEISSQENVKVGARNSRKILEIENLNTSKSRLRAGVIHRIWDDNSYKPLRVKQTRLFGKRNSIREFIPDSSSDPAKWLLFALGVGLLILIGGYGALMAVFAIGWGESVSFALAIFLISLIPGLFYLWASYLYDGLEDHSKLYQFGFWGTITILPAVIALPIWIFAAIRDAINDGDFDEITSLILNAFAWIILIFGEIFSIVTTMYYIYWNF